MKQGSCIYCLDANDQTRYSRDVVRVRMIVADDSAPRLTEATQQEARACYDAHQVWRRDWSQSIVRDAKAWSSACHVRRRRSIDFFPISIDQGTESIERSEASEHGKNPNYLNQCQTLACRKLRIYP